MKKFDPAQFLFFLFLVVLNSGCATTEQMYYIAPSELAGVHREMKTAGFWITRHPSPHETIMSADQIARFNRRLQDDLYLTKDILNLPEMSGPQTVQGWKEDLGKFKMAGYYMANGRKADGAFFSKIDEQIADTGNIVKISPQYGFIVRYADQRIFPTDEPLYAKAGDIDFDELQNSTLDVGTPVAVLASSRNDQWYYVESALSGGWVRKQNVALCPVDQIKFYYDQPEFVVTTRAKTDIFTDIALTRHYDYARMGTKFIRHEVSDENMISVYLPGRDKDGKMTWFPGYLRSNDVHQGYVPYTAANIISQAFELLNEPYGWGGMYGEQDCSAFLDEVYATVGIRLPRNSSAQRQAGKVLAEFHPNTPDADKISAIMQAVPGKTLLGLKGHIMLYLGTLDARPFAIHAVWAYREPLGRNREDRIRVINRVAVTDLYLGEDSKKGSLLNRITEVVGIDPQP